MEQEEHLMKCRIAYYDPYIIKMMDNVNIISISTITKPGEYLLEIEVKCKYSFNEEIVLSTGETIKVKFV